ncbi:Pet127-domain-containing protein [Bimuria novae-zelandiae CBS 107.79]|uniref:Pet127-domain-containing protein n=1 Tax=Bimuria novae-zelandiae CBS 107.79 TaxID=1447943 RepID=A0A6A5V399_9PLEO|nr:Pet127-domain-containing protein [Bimuria novae-zelandiae CBS 107.79]
MRKQIEAIQKTNKEIYGDIPARQVPSGNGLSIRKHLTGLGEGQSLKDALTGASAKGGKPKKPGAGVSIADFETLDIKHLNPEELDFAPVDHKIPPVPRLSYGLDRVLFSPGVYRLQDPRSRVYNFDPYLEKIMSVEEFNFDALSEYKTSSKDEELLALTQRMGTKFTGSTSSMSGVLQHFHFLLSNFRPLNHEMLSKSFPSPTDKFSKITEGPSAIFLRWKDGIYAIDADKAYDQPNIMSWLGHSLEKLLTVDRKEFERYRRSSSDAAPGEDESARCYHYSRLGNFLMRSQLDAHDPRLPGTGIFDLKTRAVVSIRMNHQEYETGKGYQIRHDHGEWESYEREFYDMTRATMLKYSLQVRMGRMDGIFVAYHNVDRIFGFQYLPLEDLDNVLHGQKDTCLGNQEFKMSIALLDELMQKATEKYPEQTLRLHFHTHKSSRGNPPFMYIFAEPVTEEEADAIQNKNQEAYKAFERDVVGIKKDDPALQAEWHEIQDRVDEELDGDGEGEVAEMKEAKEVEAVDESEASDQGSVASSTEEGTEQADEPLVEEVKKERSETPKGPLIGWTLAVRHRLNGSYVERPQSLEPNDSWTIEYHIRELNEDDRWNLYEKVKTKRNKLIGEAREETSASLQTYRALINKYTEKGRKWREEQDALAAQTEAKVFQPLGPGSEVESTG